MDYALNEMDTKSCMEVFHKLLKQGVHRIVVSGATPSACSFLEIARGFISAGSDCKLIHCDNNHATLQGAKDIIHPDQAYRNGCDAVMIFDNDVAKAFDEINSLAPDAPHIVYKSSPPDDCLFISFPKCGSHLFVLLLNSLELPTIGDGRPKTTIEQRQEAPDNTHVLRHFVDETPPRVLLNLIERENLKVVFSFRDPRAQALSFVNFFSADKFRDLHSDNPLAVPLVEKYSSLPDTHSRLKYFLEHDIQFHNFDNRYALAFQTHIYLLLHPDVCTVRYEKLVGSMGGGDDKSQLGEIKKVMRYLGVAGRAEEIAKSLYRTNTPTFHKGSIDAWREHFNDEISALFKTRYPKNIMDLYGYEW